MANPAALTVTALAANAGTNQPAVQTIDTTGTVPITIGGPMDRLVIEVINGAAAVLTVTLLAGASPPALGARALAITMAATGTATDKQILGPFESGRFLQADGSVNVNFTPASGSPSATVRVYRLPKQI